MPWQWTANTYWTGSVDQSKGKGGGKGREEPSGRKWPCPEPKCKALHKGVVVMMLPHTKACRVCGTPKAAAAGIHDSKVAALREEVAAKAAAPVVPALSKRAQRKIRNANAKADADQKPPAVVDPPPKAAAAKPAAAGPPKVVPPPAPAAAAVKDEWLPKPLPDLVLTATAKVEGAISEVLNSLELDRFPTEKSTEDLDQEISARLVALQPTEGVKAQEKVAQVIADLQSQVTLSEGRLPSDIVDTMKARIKSEEVNLEKLKKKVQPRALQHAQLVQGKAEASTAFTETLQRAQTGEAKAEERSQVRQQLLGASMESLKALQAAVLEHDQQYAEAHAARGVAVDAQQKALLLKFDTLIEAASGKTDVSMAAAEEAPAVAEEGTTPQLEELSAWKTKFSQLKTQQEEQTAHLQEQIKLLMENQEKTAAERAAAVAQKSAHDAASLVAAKAAAATQAFDAVIDVDPSTLPDYEPEQAALEASSHLFSLLQQWSLRGGMVPFSLGDLREGLPKEKEITARPRAILKAMLGPVWTKLFPTELSEEAILPRQAVLIAMHSLDTLKAKFEGIQATHEAAAKSYTVLVESSKKRRASAATA